MLLSLLSIRGAKRLEYSILSSGIGLWYSSLKPPLATSRGNLLNPLLIGLPSLTGNAPVCTRYESSLLVGDLLLTIRSYAPVEEGLTNRLRARLSDPAKPTPSESVWSEDIIYLRLSNPPLVLGCPEV
jgi:hypothetical protein